MNLNQLYYFKTIARLEHFRFAAEKLNISQPSLSAAMANLEEELSVILFEKNGRNIKLTNSGKIFLKYVEDSLAILEEGIEKVTNIKKSSIAIAYVFPLSTEYIPKLIKNFMGTGRGKEIEFSLKQELTSEIMNGIKNLKYDLGFCSKVESEKDIVFEPIIEQEIILIVHKNHPLASKKEVKLKNIEKYDFITYVKDSGLGQFLSHIFENSKINLKVKFECENEQEIAGLVSQDFGIAVVGKTSLLEHPDLVQIKIKDLKEKRYIYLAYLKNKPLKPHIRKFIEYVRKNFIFV